MAFSAGVGLRGRGLNKQQTWQLLLILVLLRDSMALLRVPHTTGVVCGPKLTPRRLDSVALDARRRSKATKTTTQVAQPEVLSSIAGSDSAAGGGSVGRGGSSGGGGGGGDGGIAGVLDVNSFGVAKDVELSKLNSRSSKLTPLTGTIQSKVAEYESKNWLERTVGEYAAPTPVGQEPKLFKTMKTITWGAVLLLVLTEIVVSLKVGGAPFKFGEIQLPSLPSMPMLTGGAGPPQL